MLTSALSRIFWYAFILIIIGGIGDIISQITLKPLKFNTGRRSSFSIAKPGLVFDAQIISRPNERMAPDTSVNYSFEGIAGPTGGGTIRLNENEFHNYKQQLSRLIEVKKATGQEIKLDTQVTFIGEIQWEKDGYLPTTSGVKPKGDKFVYSKSYMDEKNKKIKDTDTFLTSTEAEKVLYLSQYKTPYKISEEMSGHQRLRILPSNRLQQIIFIAYRSIQIISLTFIFLSLSRLFKNFFNHSYFTYQNVGLLKKLGFYILIPQIVNIAFYWSFLRDIYPVKIFASYTALHQVKMLSQYDFNAGVDGQLTFVGLSLIVLSHIFKDGLKMKEEQQLTV